MNHVTLNPTLILGYGNVDRQDDGVAWHILSRLAARLGRPLPLSVDEFEFTPNRVIDFLFSLQLYPEMADLLSQYARVCFIDAHTGAVPDEIHCEQLTPEMQSSPFTHHLTASSVLSMTQAMGYLIPETQIISVRGYQFGFAQQLSPETDLLADQAVEMILEWLEKS